MSRRLCSLAMAILMCGCALTDDDKTEDVRSDAGWTPVGEGCSNGGNAYPAGTSTGSLRVGGERRTFRVFVPTSYRPDQPTPVVLLLHGGGGSGEQLEERSSGMNPIAERERFIAVYPDGTGLVRTWNAGNCCGRAQRDEVDDVAFIDALLDHLDLSLCTDNARIFATGMSNGAMLSHRLACELSERIAAIAPVAGTIGVSDCQPSRPVAVLQIHGTADGHVPWAGGVGCGPSGADFTSVPETMEGWRLRNGCETDNPTTFEQGDGKCEIYPGCEAAVALCAVEGGGHSWPGGLPTQGAIECPGNGGQSTTFPASEQMWKFFEANLMRR